MRAALDAGIYQFNVESEAGTGRAERGGAAMGKRAPITIRVNPDVDAKTHAKITTGTAETKFGISWTRARAAYARAAELPGIEVVGVDVHIGSQITDLVPFEAAFNRVVELIAILRGGRPQHRAGSIWAAGWACPIAPTTSRRRTRPPMAR